MAPSARGVQQPSGRMTWCLCWKKLRLGWLEKISPTPPPVQPGTRSVQGWICGRAGSQSAQNTQHRIESPRLYWPGAYIISCSSWGFGSWIHEKEDVQRIASQPQLVDAHQRSDQPTACFPDYPCLEDPWHLTSQPGYWKSGVSLLGLHDEPALEHNGGFDADAEEPNCGPHVPWPLLYHANVRPKPTYLCPTLDSAIMLPNRQVENQAYG